MRDLEAKNINLANDIIALETAEKTKKQSILDAEMKCRDLVVFDPEDLERFRQEYSILVLTHLWRPIELCAAKQVWLFDGIIQGTLVLQGSNYLVKLAVNHDHVDTNLVQISKSSAHIVKCLGIERIEGALRWHEKEWTSVEPTQLKKVPSLTQVFDSIAFLWESMKALYRDVQDAQSVCPIAMVGTSFRLDATFFSLAKRTRFTVTFEFDVKRGWLLYPSGQWSWSMVLDYGEFNHDMDELFHVATGSGMIAKWCRLIQEKLARE